MNPVHMPARRQICYRPPFDDTPRIMSSLQAIPAIGPFIILIQDEIEHLVGPGQLAIDGLSRAEVNLVIEGQVRKDIVPLGGAVVHIAIRNDPASAGTLDVDFRAVVGLQENTGGCIYGNLPAAAVQIPHDVTGDLIDIGVLHGAGGLWAIRRDPIYRDLVDQNLARIIEIEHDGLVLQFVDRQAVGGFDKLHQTIRVQVDRRAVGIGGGVDGDIIAVVGQRRHEGFLMGQQLRRHVLTVCNRRFDDAGGEGSSIRLNQNRLVGVTIDLAARIAAVIVRVDNQSAHQVVADLQPAPSFIG